MRAARASAERTGAAPPCGWRSVTKLDLKYCKGKINLKRTLDSKVGSSDLLGRANITFKHV